jgi:hypothetical protein
LVAKHIKNCARDRCKEEAREEQMVKAVAVAAFAVVMTTSVQAMPIIPLYQGAGLTTQVAVGCGAGRTRVTGV